MKLKSIAMGCLAAAFVVVASGCSATGAAWETMRLGKNASKKDSHLDIWVDGQEAKQDKLKKAYFGHASFKVSDPVSTAPTVRYAFDEPGKFGRITSMNMAIYQEFEGDFSHQPEFTIYPANPNDATTLPKPGDTIDLANPPANLKIMNFERQPASGVQLTPGLEYMLVFTVSGDRSETVQILFETK